LAVPWLVKLAIDVLTTGGASSGAFRRVAFYCGLILAVCLAQYAFRFVLSRLYNRVVYRGSARLRHDLYRRIQSRPLTSLAERRVGEVLTHLVADVQTLQDSCLDLISEIPFDVCVLAGLAVAMLVLNPPLALVTLLFLAGSILAAFGLGRRGWRSHRKAMESAADLTSRIQEGLSSARALALFDGAGTDDAALRCASERNAEDLEQAGKTRAAVTPFLGFAEYAGIVLVLLIGGWCMLHGSLTAGGLVAFLAYMEMSADPMARSATIVPGLQKAMVAASRLGGLLEETDSAPEKPGALRPTRLNGDVDVRGLSFTYPGGRRPALSNLTFSVRAGEKVAVTGRNGSGKSTFLDLFLRLQPPLGGVIVVDGMNVEDVSLSSWRSLVGVVPQDTRLLNRSVADNISLGEAASPDSVEAAAEAAGLDGWVRRLPRGTDTVLGEGGAHLSGGERQRVAIARLFHRNPSLVVLDEPTSALDAENDLGIRPALRRLCRGRTSFIVSHRPEILEDADKVLLLDEGRQIAFTDPRQAWRNFPEFRPFFPASWGSESRQPEVVL
jgi:ABC-type multidrug transport system fused ATPase/permease subunit